jgi:hypothetical protein
LRLPAAGRQLSCVLDKSPRRQRVPPQSAGRNPARRRNRDRLRENRVRPAAGVPEVYAQTTPKTSEAENVQPSGTSFARPTEFLQLTDPFALGRQAL